MKSLFVDARFSYILASMNQTRETFITALALFSLFFGAGNLILPPLLGFKAGGDWWLVGLGFGISAVMIPIFGIVAHARLQGTMFDFAKKISPKFSLVYCYLVYAISISLPSPRTASVTHEIAILPFFESSYLITSLIYFLLVFIFVMNRAAILNIIGKYLTPAILIVLFAIVSISVFNLPFDFEETLLPNPISSGILEGYQTFDAIGAVVCGAVIIVSVNLKARDMPYQYKRQIIARAGWLAGLGLFLVYLSLILTGALNGDHFPDDISRTALLSGISNASLGNTANIFLSLLVSLACFTTAVGIVTGAADFVKSQFPSLKNAYLITAILGCLLGVLMGQFNVGYIIAVALPALMFIYPITIVLIFLNAIPARFAPATVFKAVVFATILFSIPDFLETIGMSLQWAKNIPLSEFKMGWFIPSLLVYASLMIFKHQTK